jgi:hypothetical protein
MSVIPKLGRLRQKKHKFEVKPGLHKTLFQENNKTKIKIKQK